MRRHLELEKFTWKNGGTILPRGGWRGPFDIKFKYNPEHNGIDLLSISW